MIQNIIHSFTVCKIDSACISSPNYRRTSCIHIRTFCRSCGFSSIDCKSQRNISVIPPCIVACCIIVIHKFCPIYGVCKFYHYIKICIVISGIQSISVIRNFVNSPPGSWVIVRCTLTNSFSFRPVAPRRNSFVRSDSTIFIRPVILILH